MKAICLLSGGLDSTVILAMALSQGRQCHALSFDYGQRHRIELDAARAIAQFYKVSHKLIRIDPASFAASSLVSDIPVATFDDAQKGIPNTYVPARNTLFLAYAIAQAEILGADEIYFGPNAMDQQGYPDCRPDYVAAVQAVAQLATQQAVEGRPPKIVTPLIYMSKTDIVRKGYELGAPMGMTFSCYDPTPQGKPCSRCQPCVLRENAFSNYR